MTQKPIELDVRLLSFADVVRLSALPAGRIHGMVQRGAWSPDYPQRPGTGGNNEIASYTARDLCRLMLAAECARHRVSRAKRENLKAELDRVLDGGAAGVPVELGTHPWCHLTFDLSRLAAEETARVAEYVRLRGNGTLKAATA